VSDHFFLDLGRYGGSSEPSGTLESFTGLAPQATITNRARHRTLVACAPLRHPAHIAKMATAIDLLSGGRFDLGLGAGWYQREFEAFGYEFGSSGDRLSRLEDTAEAVARLFNGGPVDMKRGSVELSGAFNHPAPAQPGGPPIWIGGKGGPRLLRIVARHAAGWNTVWRWALADYRGRIQELERRSEAEGRDPSTVRRSIGLYTLVGEDDRDVAARYEALQRWTPGGALDAESLEDYARTSLTGTVESCLERLSEYAALGVEEFIVGAASLPFAVFDWSMVELIADAVVPRARGL
jgi:alkanesulfonate monooxygenase SsuD/methylene tetrahydromethanopterin reductase-like flavin-dependent oxidoreductase (luciferase family)